MSRRRRRKSKMKTYIVTFTLLLVLGCLGVSIFRLYKKNEAYAAKQQALEQQLQSEEERKEDLSAYEKFTQTMDYVEQIAREKLGLVFDNEIIFKEDD